MIEATLYDGATAEAHSVRVTAGHGTVELTTESGWTDSVDAALLRRLDVGRNSLRLGRTDIPGWRLLMPPDAEAELGSLLGREDRYGFPAHVASMSPGTGSEFAVLPPENATGNWVKVVQRLPVRLEFDALDPQWPLYSGISVTVRIDTRARPSRATPEAR